MAVASARQRFGGYRFSLFVGLISSKSNNPVPIRTMLAGAGTPAITSVSSIHEDVAPDPSRARTQ